MRDEDLQRLRAEIGDTDMVPDEYKALAELHAVLEFLRAKGIEAPALSRQYQAQHTSDRQAAVGNNALRASDVVFRGAVVGAVDWLVSLSECADMTEQDRHDTVANARKRVSAATKVPFERVRRWHQDANNAGANTKAGQCVLTVATAACKARAHMADIYRPMHNQMSADDVILLFFTPL